MYAVLAFHHVVEKQLKETVKLWKMDYGFNSHTDGLPDI